MTGKPCIPAPFGRVRDPRHSSADLAEQTRLFQAAQHQHARAIHDLDIDEQERMEPELALARETMCVAWLEHTLK